MDEYTLDDNADNGDSGDELEGFGYETSDSDSSIWDRLLLNRISDDRYDHWVHGSLLLFLLGLIILIISPLLWSLGGFYIVLLSLLMMVIGGGLVYILLGRPSLPELSQQIVTWKQQSVNKVKSTLPFISSPQIEEEDKELDEYGALDLGLQGEDDEEEGLTTVDTHLESAFVEQQSPSAQAESYYAERSDEEWLADGVVPPKVAARIAMEAGARTKELSEQVIELMDAREEAQKQRHTEQCNLMEAVIDNLQKLNHQLEILVETWPEDDDPTRLVTVATRGQQYPMMQPMAMVSSPAMEGTSSETHQVPSGPIKADLLAVDTSTIPEPVLQQKVGDSVIVDEVNNLMQWPFVRLLQSREVDEKVLDILAGTDASYWRIRNLRVAKTPHKELRLNPQQAEELIRQLDHKLQSVRDFDDPALRAGLILKGLGDPFYRLCIVNTIFPEGEGEPVKPNLDDYARVVAATGLDSWLELLRQGDLDKISQKMTEGESGTLSSDYYLLAPIAQTKLREALLSEYIKKQRRELAILLDPGSEQESSD